MKRNYTYFVSYCVEYVKDENHKFGNFIFNDIPLIYSDNIDSIVDEFERRLYDYERGLDDNVFCIIIINFTLVKDK